MESPQMYDNNQNNIQMTGQQTKSNGQNNTNNQNNNNNNPITINQNLKNDHINGLTNSAALLQKQIQHHPQQVLQQQQQQIQHVAQQYSQNDLEELTNPEISLDLANFIDDQFRSEQEQFAFFNKVVPAVVNGVNGVVNGVNVNGLVQSEAAKALQQARFQHRQNPGNALAYMPGCVTGNTDDASTSEANIKEEPVDPIELRRLQQLTANGQFLNGNYQFPNVNSSGTTFTALTPASVLHHQPHVPGLKSHLTNFQKLNKNLVHSRKHSMKNLDKGTDEYRRRRERNNIAVRKSREKAKKRAHDVEKKLKDLQKENENLRRSDDEKTNVILLYNQVFMRLTNHSNPEIKQIVSLELNSMNMQCDQGMQNMQNSLLHNGYKDS
ncbi:CLUMA_CG020842, isoform A [Clunio marinus]|uniref:CLUMA_CG020842, isoform A n=1 Tax=Clunio marinus TaxID=568069 RepID=A0A1J1J716_9DIPT|nr:CLUMA_CG020842, isoform A [Clunio marinus]